MYSLINFLSALVRKFVLPNPYRYLIDNQIYSELFNIIFGGFVLHFFAYSLTGIIYKKGEDPYFLGSVYYLLFYVLTTFLITYTSYFLKNFYIFALVIIVFYSITYILLSIFFGNKHTIKLWKTRLFVAFFK